MTGGSGLTINTDVKPPGPFPKYTYGFFINSPNQMGMGPGEEGWGLKTIGDNFGGLISYIQLLITGTSRASRAAAIDYQVSNKSKYQPLGNAYVFNTGLKCTDVNGNPQDSVAYVNNIPLGNMPLLSDMGLGNMQELRGLIPGIFENLNGFNPMIIAGALDISDGEPCNREVETDAAYSLPVTNIKEDGTDYDRTDGKPPVGYYKFYMFDSLVAEIDPCLFRGTSRETSSRKNPVTGRSCIEKFSNINNQNSNIYQNNYEKLQKELDMNINMLKNISHDDWVVQLYYISIAILLIFILIKIFNKHN